MIADPQLIAALNAIADAVTGVGCAVVFAAVIRGIFK